MGAIEIDVCFGAAILVNALGAECDRLTGCKQLASTRFDFLAKGLLGGAVCSIACFRTVPSDQSQPNPFWPINRKTAQLKCVAIYSAQVPG